MSLLYLVAVLVGLSALAQGQVWPKLPKSYTSWVSANFLHYYNQNNFYTLDYSEAYDNVTNAYMTQGRFKNSHVVEVFYFSSGVVFSWDSRDPDNTCTFIGWADYPQKEQVTPSVWMLSNLTSGSIKYTNRTLDVRFILTDGFNVTFPGSTYLVNFAPGTTPGVDQAPVRIEKLVYGNNGQIAERELYDWVNFISGRPPPSLFKIPSGCQQAKPPSSLPIPTNNGLPNPYIPSPQVPKAPRFFTALLEGKMDTDTDDNDEKNDRVHAMVWDVDTDSRSERLDFYKHSNPDDRNSPTVVVSWIYQYTPGKRWGTDGLMYKATLNYTTRQYQDCVFDGPTYFEEKTESPLHNYRAGVMSMVFAEQNIFMAPPNNHVLVSQPEDVPRGVPADAYRGSHVTWNDGTTYYYTTDVYYYPIGWAFPGRDINETARLPIRIVNRGNFTNSSGPYEYRDKWDLFSFVPTRPPAARFDPLSIGCKPYVPPPTLPPKDNTQLQLIAGAVGGVVVGLIVAAIAFVIWRRYNPPTGASSEVKSNVAPIELKNVE